MWRVERFFLVLDLLWTWQLFCAFMCSESQVSLVGSAEVGTRLLHVPKLCDGVQSTVPDCAARINDSTDLIWVCGVSDLCPVGKPGLRCMRRVGKTHTSASSTFHVHSGFDACSNYANPAFLLRMLYVILAFLIGHWVLWTDGARQPSGVPLGYCRSSGSAKHMASRPYGNAPSQAPNQYFGARGGYWYL